MSTVLWANRLEQGKVVSDQADKHALYRHAKKLDRLTKRLGVARFSSLQDLTDAKFNMTEQELPAGMTSTDELMARQGVWIPTAQAVVMLEKLIAHTVTNKTRFGWFDNEHDAVVRELEETLTFAMQRDGSEGRFNFSVVL